MAFSRFCRPIQFALPLLAAILWASGLPAQTRIRIVAANITSGNNQAYEGPGTRILDGLNPDIVLIQEFSVGDDSTTTISNWVTSTFGSGYTYFREPGGQSIPNGIISRYPILASGEIDDTEVPDRDHAWARIDIPGAVDLYAISVHLKASSGSANVSMRNRQAADIRDWINANVPAGAYVAVGGDYNTQNHSESCLTTLSSVVVTSSPYPADQSGNTNTNAGRDKPYDRLHVNTAFNALRTGVLIGTNTHTNGLVFDTRVYTPLSAVSPAQLNDSGATNMQHMAVVKDFLVQEATPTPSPSPSPTASPSPSPTPSVTPTKTPVPASLLIIGG